MLIKTASGLPPKRSEQHVQDSWQVTAAAQTLYSENLADRSATPDTYDDVHEILVRHRSLELPVAGDLVVQFPPHSATLIEVALQP